MSESAQDPDLSNAIFISWNEDGSTKVLSHKGQRDTSLETTIPVVTERLEIHKDELGIDINSMHGAHSFYGVEHVVDDENEIVTEITNHEASAKLKHHKRKLGGSSIKIKQEPDDNEYSENKSNKIRKRFSRNWFNIPEFSNWLEEASIPGYAHCNVCKKNLLPGKSELLKHAATAKHIKKMEAYSLIPTTGELIKRVIDLRSDTVTTPNSEMREAMKTAEVGDDAYREDPTVAELEQKVAALLGKEAALFLPSGTMANLIAVLSHCWSRGSLVIIGDQSHMHRASQGSFSEIASVTQRIVHNNKDGSFELSELRDILKSHGPYWPTTTLVCIENAHTMVGGKALPQYWLDELGELCSSYNIPIHLDGARLVNASAAVGSSPLKLSRHCSSVTFCLNKGLGAPGGSILASSREFINRATIFRKTLGGIIHQAGILAAAGLYGLTHFVARISKDHANARALAKAVCNINGGSVTVDVSSVQTNVVMLICDNIRVTPQQLCERLAMHTNEEELDIKEKTIVKAEPIPPNIVRLMTHGDLLMDDIKATCRKLQYVINEFDNCFVRVIQYI